MALIIYLLLKFSVLSAFWIALSGKFDTLHLSMGFASVVLVMIMTRRKGHPGRSAKAVSDQCRLYFGFFLYIPWLCFQIFLAAIHVSKLLLNPKLPINPGIIRHKSILLSDRHKVIFGNSITLTPGTITSDLDKDYFVVHQLDQDSAAGILDHSMEKKIQSIFKEESKA